MPTSVIAAALPAVISTGVGLAADSLMGGGGAESVGSSFSELKKQATPGYKTLNIGQVASPFDAAAKTLKNTSYAQSMRSPGLNIGVDKKGTVTTKRTGYAQSLIDQLRSAGGDAVELALGFGTKELLGDGADWSSYWLLLHANAAIGLFGSLAFVWSAR